ncbi:hybrid sensor histidine kinase/response regulator transcription factor [Pedobacter sp. BMA]|uniref:hybrid sensor histidine kinase/response regulator transcription factor n=1 Tax=Pedobacter sp. BMA TaxID=1663685 RepID=UPI00064A4F7C|nr:hybrid sensor histidine kinase/response regulator transcription factor [Pedobacter sp. BMA]KLT67439.1 hypothetical protein AB669_01725 [Pedobacter sp. BMA]
MNCRLLTCLLSSFLMFCLNSAAQQTISFDHLGVEKGLSQSSVISIAQDQQGFMWLGTRLGLNRYDGYRFKVYQHDEKDPESISNNYITALYTDSRKTLWIGTISGLNIYHPENDHFEQVLNDSKKANTLKGISINCITEDRKGNIWIGTQQGVFLFKDGNPLHLTRYFNPSQPKPAINAKAIKEDHLGNIWVGTASGLFCLVPHDQKFSMVSYLANGKAGSISDNNITSILEDHTNRLWVGTQRNGLNLWNSSTATFSIFNHSAADSHSLVNNTIRSLELDDQGRLWVGTLDGISILNQQGSFTNLQYEPDNKSSLNQNSIYKLYKDKNGSMWVGTYFGGVNINYPYHTSFKIYQRSNGKSSINNNVISGFAEDNQKNLWIGTEGGGLNFYNHISQQYVAFLSTGASGALRSNLIKKIFYDRNGTLWVGTHSGGLSCYDPKSASFRHFDLGSETETNLLDEIVSIDEDQHGRLWVATQRNGIKISNTAKTSFLNYALPAAFPKAAKVKYMIINDRVYFGTTYGLFILNPLRNEFYSINDPQTKERINFFVNCLLETKKGEIYIGTNHMGMIKYDQLHNRIIRYTKKSGLPNDDVFGLMEDEKGNIWIGTANGLSMLDQQSQSFKNYTISDGLPGNEFNSNAFFRKSDGEMLFGGYNGFVGFYPDKIQTNTQASEMTFTDLILDNQPVKINGEDLLLEKNIVQTKKLVLGNDQNTFTLDFALLNFIKPEKNQYLYKLEGFEKKWNRGNIPSVTYTNLPTGNYRFLVKGINNDGIYSSNMLNMDIRIKPPFYSTWWAYLFYVLVAALIVALLLRYIFLKAILFKEKEISAHKLEFFTNISHEIRTPLTLILGPLDKLIEETRDQWQWNKELQPIKNNADRLMRLVTELLDFRKAESGKMQLEVSPGNIVQFTKEIYLAFRDLAAEKKIDYKFECAESDIKLYFDQKQLEKVLYNLLSNAIKFGHENGKVLVSLKPENGTVAINVSNEGKGIPLDQQSNLFDTFYQVNPGLNIGTGIGLSFSKTIVELHHGEISFESTPETIEKTGFTRFTVLLKTGKDFFKAEDLVEDDREYEALSGYSFSPVPVSEESFDQESEPDTDFKERFTILLVEDNQDIRFFIKSYLSQDYDVVVCENGRQGWEYAIEQIPDIIISDVMMPEMDGLTLCSKLKTDERTSHIPIVLLTARSAYVHQISGLETGADVYMTKPFNIRLLKVHLQNLLATREKIKSKFSNVMVLEPTHVVIRKADEDFLNKLIATIEDNIVEQFDVPFLAKKMGMSQPVLYKKLRALTGISVNDFIKSIRLKRAAQLLDLKSGSITDIAYSVGFNDRKYFSVEFKKFFGVSPREYQSGMRQQ